jgi:hypothetical protein
LLNVCEFLVAFGNQETTVAVKGQHFHFLYELPEHPFVLFVPTVQSFA